MMVRTSLLIFTFFITSFVRAQSLLNIAVKDRDGAALPAVNLVVKGTDKVLSADSNGIINYTGPVIPGSIFLLSHTGFKTIEWVIPQTGSSEVIEIFMDRDEDDLDEVIVNSTRNNGLIKNIPTRIEILSAEELDEKSTMKPGDIKMLLNESTGISTQQTSPVSSTADIRIQGLDGRYTQILKDGMPLYTGLSGGLSILQIAPLDLKQVEYIKGSASTLYGGGAIAGLINLVTKTPGPKPELNFLVNVNSAKGLDANSFYSQKGKKQGVTVFGSYNRNGAYDPAGIGFTAIPKTERVTLNPKLFFYINEKTTAWVGINTSFERRLGGDMIAVKGRADSLHQYFEQNKTSRISVQSSLSHRINTFSSFNIKNSAGVFSRDINVPGFSFTGRQVSSFSEFNYINKKTRSEWIMGLNEWTEKFMPRKNTLLSYELSTLGAFVQNTFKINNWFTAESGLRADKNFPASRGRPAGIFILPRINFLFRINNALTSRIGGGLGYKMPTPFIEDAEKTAFQNINSIDFAAIEAEQSYGLNADINYRKHFDEIKLSINQFFFYTRLNDPILLQSNLFFNASGFTDTKGSETNIKISKDELAFYLGYTYTDAQQHFAGNVTPQPLSARHRINADITYEIENRFRFGAEGYYTGSQLLSDETTGHSYIIFGLLVQKMWKRFSVFVNAENLTDRRQTRFGSIWSGTVAHPMFDDIYAPLDGAVVNAGVKIRLL